MSTYKQRMNAFSDGRREAFAEIRKSIKHGVWNEEVRASWMKETVSARSHVRYAHPYLKRVAAYHAGYLSALKSRQGERFANDYQDGWDWYGDEDNLGVARPARKWDYTKLQAKQTLSMKGKILIGVGVLLVVFFILLSFFSSPGLTLFLLYISWKRVVRVVDWKACLGKRENT